jgi:hypothetical protein
MPRPAKSTREGAAWDSSPEKAAIDKSRADQARKATFVGKTFASLTPVERDDLLKAVAIKLGLIEE